MSLWDRLVRWAGQTFDLKDASAYEVMDHAQPVTQEAVSSASVLGLTAAWGCVSLLSGTISSLSCDVYRKQGKIKVRADHPLEVVLADPNADQTEVDFWEQMALSLELWGNAYARIGRRGDGSISSLTPLRPDAVSVERTTGGRIRYVWYEGGKRFEAFEDTVFHIRGKGGDALGGMSPVSFHRNSFGTAQAVERSAGATFANEIRASGYFYTDEILTLEQRQSMESGVRKKYQGARNTGVPMILDNGTKWQTLSFNPEDAQMLQSRAFSVEEVCRIFDVPPFMVGHTEKVTSWGSGLEQQILGFQKFALRKRLKKIEKAIVKQLMSPEDRRAGFTVSFNIEDLLRGDSKARAEYYDKMLRLMVYTINEVRALEGREPVPWGDAPWVQMQDTQIGHNGGPPLEDDDEQSQAA